MNFLKRLSRLIKGSWGRGREVSDHDRDAGLPSRPVDRLWGDTRQPTALAAREWQLTFDAISDMVLLLDPQLRVVRANKACVPILGRDHSDILGKNCYDLFVWANEPGKDCSCRLTLRDRQPHSEEVLSLSGVPFLLSSSPILDADQAFLGIVQVGKDITEIKRLQADLDKKIQYLESFKEVMVARENRMLEVKHEINRLCREFGREPPYLFLPSEE